MFERTRKMQEPAERSLPHRNDVDRDSLAADEGRGNAPFGLAITARRSLEQFRGRRKRFAEGRMRQRIDRVLEEQARGIGERARRIERRVTHLVKPVHGGGKNEGAFRGRRRRTTKFTNRHQHLSGARFLRCNILKVFGPMRQRKSTFLTHHPTRHKYAR